MSLSLVGCTVVELLLLGKNVSSSQYMGPAVEMIAYLVTSIMTLGAMRNIPTCPRHSGDLAIFRKTNCYLIAFNRA